VGVNPKDRLTGVTYDRHKKQTNIRTIKPFKKGRKLQRRMVSNTKKMWSRIHETYSANILLSRKKSIGIKVQFYNTRTTQAWGPQL